MPKILYTEKNFSAASLDVIAKANAICAEYQAQGFDLTLRQAYYQFVARGYIPNSDKEYKRLGSIINDARLAGLMDWNYIVDRTRNIRLNSHWSHPSSILESAAYGYANDKWLGMPVRPIVMIEKDALVGVIEGVCTRNDVAYFSCRGYTSQSEMWSMGQRLLGYIKAHQEPVIIHLGDHDPSGIDMSRDIQDRLNLFVRRDSIRFIDIRRIALNMDQVDQYNPPPNPAKITDSRANSYIERFGDESWELDALEPTVIDALIQTAIDRTKRGAEDIWAANLSREQRDKRILQSCYQRWDEVTRFLNGHDDAE